MTRAERSREKARYWQELVDEHAKSGKKDSVFSRERRIGVHSLRAWRYRLAREAALRRVPRVPRHSRRLTATVDFVPVRVRGAEATTIAVPTPSARSGSGVELVLPGDRVVRVHRDFDEQTLLRLVAVLEKR